MDSTANLGLHLPAQNDYADIVVLNENFEKIDAAMAAARSAEEYDPAGTYAVGSYCTHDGKLYRCTTAITAAEAWTAAHWEATSVGAELLAIIAALAGKADIPQGIETGADINNYKSPGMYYCGADEVASTIQNLPISGAAFSLCVDDMGFGNVFQVVKHWDAYGHPKTFIRSSYPTWTAWELIATATPPTEYDLPLLNGWTQLNSSDPLKIGKCGDGRVQIMGIVISPTSSDHDQQIATLPEDCRPIGRIAWINAIDANTGLCYVFGANIDGSIRVWVNVPPASATLVFPVQSFYGS